MDGRSRIAWNLRQLRTAHGFTQEALAFDAGVDRTYISGIEQKQFNPTIDLLDKLAAALSVDLVDLVSVPPPGSPEPSNLTPGRKPRQ